MKSILSKADAYAAIVILALPILLLSYLAVSGFQHGNTDFAVICTLGVAGFAFFQSRQFASVFRSAVHA